MPAHVRIPLSTLRWWRELVDANPTDLAPRIDAAMARATGADDKDHLLADVASGGNHLASSLVHTLGADFAERFPPDANVATVREAIYSRVNGTIGASAAWLVVYDIWVAWSAIMRLCQKSN